MGSIRQSILDGLMDNFWILHLYKCFKSPLRDLHLATKKCLPNTLITFQSKYYLRNRATPGRIYFSTIEAGNMQMGCLYADLTRLCGSVTPLPPVTTGLMMISSLTPITHISMIGCKQNLLNSNRYFWICKNIYNGKYR